MDKMYMLILVTTRAPLMRYKKNPRSIMLLKYRGINNTQCSKQ